MGSCLSLPKVSDKEDCTLLLNSTDNSVHSNENLQQKYPCLIICGPSGVGKGTLIEALKTKYKNEFEDSVSFTTRNPRDNEINGKHYYFINKQQFKEREKKNDFIETANFCDNYYGTSASKLKEIMNKNKIPLLEVVMSSAQKIKSSNIDTFCIFISICESSSTEDKLDFLEERLKNRDSETNEKIKKRLKTAEQEFKLLETKEYKQLFDEILYNDNLEHAKQELFYILEREYPRLKQIELTQPLLKFV